MWFVAVPKQGGSAVTRMTPVSVTTFVTPPRACITCNHQFQYAPFASHCLGEDVNVEDVDATDGVCITGVMDGGPSLAPSTR